MNHKTKLQGLCSCNLFYLLCSLYVFVLIVLIIPFTIGHLISPPQQSPKRMFASRNDNLGFRNAGVSLACGDDSRAGCVRPCRSCQVRVVPTEFRAWLFDVA